LREGALVKITVIKGGKRRTFTSVKAAKKFAGNKGEVTVIVTA
jgi:hypothetical protein